MKVKDIIQKTTQEELIEIYDTKMQNIYSGMNKFIDKSSNFLDKKVKNIWCEECFRAICIQYEDNDTKSHKDRPIVGKVKKEMIRNAIGLSDIGFMTYLNYLNITISMLFSFDVISKNEYDDLLKYLSNVDWHRICKKEE